jgi:hypothetical protein
VNLDCALLAKPNAINPVGKKNTIHNAASHRQSCIRLGAAGLYLTRLLIVFSVVPRDAIDAFVLIVVVL